jgi:DNA modification methylase
MITPLYQRNDITLYHGDCHTVLQQYPDHHFSALVTDPPCSNSNWSASDVGAYVVGNRFGRFLKGDAAIILLTNPIPGYWLLRNGSVQRVSNPSLQSYWTPTHPHTRPVAELKAVLAGLQVIGPILDPFAGSGAILVAAQALSIPSVGIEIEGRYCHSAVWLFDNVTIESGV